MTPGQQAIAEGFAINLAIHGQVWTRTSDSAAITGLATRVQAEKALMPQAQDREQAILVADAALSPIVPASQVMPSTRVTNGDELTKGSRKYRVLRADFEEANLLWLLTVSPTF